MGRIIFVSHLFNSTKNQTPDLLHGKSALYQFDHRIHYIGYNEFSKTLQIYVYVMVFILFIICYKKYNIHGAVTESVERGLLCWRSGVQFPIEPHK